MTRLHNPPGHIFTAHRFETSSHVKTRVIKKLDWSNKWFLAYQSLYLLTVIARRSDSGRDKVSQHEAHLLLGAESGYF